MHSLKKMIREAMTICGINSLARNTTRHMPRIIMYHGFCKTGDNDLQRTPIDLFRKHLNYIRKNYSPLKVSDLLLARKYNGSYPDKAVAITIDDGYEDFYDLAFPVLKELGVPATVFVVSDLTEENGWMWPDKFYYIVECLKGSSHEMNVNVSQEILSNLKKLPVKKRDEQLIEMAQKHNINIPSGPPLKYKLMSWTQLKDLTKSNLIEIGSHTCTHPIMSYLNNKDSWYEINESKDMISNKLKVEITSFCYPNGQMGDYLEEHKKMLAQAGYLCSLAAHFGYVSEKSDIYALPRIFEGGRSFNLFVSYIDGIDYFLRKLFQ
jgi:peptidoglycan/xylan/chitin deacetylase (PgdA/CDA1 family)